MAGTKRVINIGTNADDGTGDLLRAAFEKVNQNFDDVWTYGAVNSNLNITEGFDDDGEDGAGMRLLGILQKMKIYNVFVIVSRWYGGTLLGNDRFYFCDN